MTRADVAAVLDHLGTAEATAIELAAAATVLRGLAGVLVTEGDWLAAAELLDDMAAAAKEPTVSRSRRQRDKSMGAWSSRDSFSGKAFNASMRPPRSKWL